MDPAASALYYGADGRPKRAGAILKLPAVALDFHLGLTFIGVFPLSSSLQVDAFAGAALGADFVSAGFWASATVMNNDANTAHETVEKEGVVRIMNNYS